MSWGACAVVSFSDGRGFYCASYVRCCMLGRVFIFNHKIMINV